ncbi:hypothetical protein KFK09_000561 [Dendrobium nobile]|uniref:Uncharacterized protein n=1 Tax=Dendrobium nobile TaxID=94219 RepID=A0A8T3CC85_DENNO|nr:hypothetical protein KFK09_000561 [Dendrobium nobile]
MREGYELASSSSSNDRAEGSTGNIGETKRGSELLLASPPKIGQISFYSCVTWAKFERVEDAVLVHLCKIRWLLLSSFSLQNLSDKGCCLFHLSPTERERERVHAKSSSSSFRHPKTERRKTINQFMNERFLEREGGFGLAILYLI